MGTPKKTTMATELEQQMAEILKMTSNVDSHSKQVAADGRRLRRKSRDLPAELDNMKEVSSDFLHLAGRMSRRNSRSEALTEEELRKAFDSVDVSGDGFIS